jgi:iron complex outermembrane receptor protein
MRSGRTIGLVPLLVCVAAPVGAQAPDGEANESRLQEIVVTAERRSANLQDVPIAVSAFTAEDLDRRQITSLVDIAKDVPNLIGHNNVGLNTATVVYLRGIGSTQSFATVDTTVGFYVDDVYIARQNANNFGLFDVERIEVLRGPQGTLYGRNTSGGAIKIVTQRPTDEFAVKGQASVGDYGFYEVRGSLNMPVGETVALRLNAVTQQQEDGFARNVSDEPASPNIGCRQCFSRAYSRESTNAWREAVMMFSLTPTVPHWRLPSVLAMSTRVLAPVPATPSKMRTL